MIQNNRKTKIVATVGPASNSLENLEKLYLAGVNVFRLNFSHGTQQQHLLVIENIKKINQKHKSNIGILADLQGPKLRVDAIQNNAILLEEGKSIIVSTEEVLGTNEMISVTYTHLSQDIKLGESILIDDGKIELKVTKIINKTQIECVIENGGILSSKKGFNLPDTEISIPSLTEKDIVDLDFIIQHHVDWIALSFVRKSEDIIDLRKRIAAQHGTQKIIAKIEKPEAIKNIDSIIHDADAIMIARGDLAVEVPMEEMPIIQKMIIEKCIDQARPVIIATQVMESMIEAPRPTRAEITDIANGVFDGADAMMLSAETSVGKYPVKVIQAMDKIILKTEEQNKIYFKNLSPKKDSPTFLSDAVCYNACSIAEDVEATALLGMTYSGYTAFMLASYRPKSKIFIFTSNPQLIYQLSLVWGVEVFFYNNFETTDKSIRDIIGVLKDVGKIQNNDIVINTASMPIKGRGRTNMIKITVVE
ncbi:MAG: pyruvate kinase [Bacteroidetes bacterium]|nr:pyruvate kinase [Bacteroidota bacterium]